jgi:hypothetical protein
MGCFQCSPDVPIWRSIRAGFSRRLVGLSLTRLSRSRRNGHPEHQKETQREFQWFSSDAKSRPELYCATTGGLVPPQLASRLYRFLTLFRALVAGGSIGGVGIFSAYNTRFKGSRNVPIRIKGVSVVTCRILPGSFGRLSFSRIPSRAFQSETL